MAQERLQKILSKAGYGSRRKCETIITGGRVVVNNSAAQIGMKADPQRDNICVDGLPIQFQQDFNYILLYKPRGVISSIKPQDDRPFARDLVPIPGFLYPVGRLDYDSEGLMLLTNDGDLTLRLTHPRYEHEKEYHVLISKYPKEEDLRAWRQGIVLFDGYKTMPVSVSFVKEEGTGVWLSVTLKEGHKRQIREMGKATNLPVSRIIRTRIGNLKIGDLKPGQWRRLSTGEISSLRRSVGL
jgi:23S rRNA pseudouridine2605 synthase